MANLKKQTGIRISQYQVAQINDNDKKNKLLLNHNFITYAPSYFGTSTMNKNYQIPVQTLRDDFRGYLGIENAKGTWQNTIRIWSGNWIDTENRENSYVYQWKYDERGNLDYIADKWGDEEDVDKIFLLRNAPIPFEEPHQDPNPNSNKFVDKKYIDDRFNGIRKVKTSGTTLQIRPYPCVYEYSAMPSSINIVDTLTLEDGRKIKDCIEKNCLIFYIKLPTPTSTTLSVKANNVDVKWGFSGELTQLLSTAKKNGDSGLIKCYAEYINGIFTVHCTNGMNLKPGEGGTVEIDTTDTIVDGSDAVPTSNAVYDHVKSHENKNIHITPSERTTWNNKLDEIVEGDFINVTNKNTISVKTSTAITNDATTVPTTKAVNDVIADVLVTNEYNEFSFDLSNIFYEQINKEWVEKIVILSNFCIEIPHKETFYPTVGTLTIDATNVESPIITTEGMELSDVARQAIIDKIKFSNGDQSTIAALQSDVPYKVAWINDAKNKNIPTQLAFRNSSYYTNEIMRMFFYYLDLEQGKTWGGDDSYSKKYMVPGLQYRCLTRPDRYFEGKPEQYYYYSYTLNVWNGSNGSGRTLLAWDFEPNLLNIGGFPNESHGANWDGDCFTIPSYWDTIVSEQSNDLFLKDYNDFKNESKENYINKYDVYLINEFGTLDYDNRSTAYGFFTVPQNDYKINKLEIKVGNGNDANVYAKIYENDSNTLIATSNESQTWDAADKIVTYTFNTIIELKTNTKYRITFHTMSDGLLNDVYTQVNIRLLSKNKAAELGFNVGLNGTVSSSTGNTI